MSLKINKDTRSTSAKRFICSPEFGNKTGLCRGIIESVEVKTYKPKEDSKQSSFEGLEIPRLEITYIQKKENEGGYHKQSFNAIEFKDLFEETDGKDKNGNVIKRGDPTWMVRNIFSWVKHIIEAITKEPLRVEFSMTDVKGKDLNIDKPLDGAATIAAFNKIFTEIVTYLNGGIIKGARPIYKDKLFWLKMLMADSRGTINKQGNAVLPNFVPADGALELVEDGVKPYMRINIAKGESVVARASINKPNISASPLTQDSSPAEW